MEYSSYSHILSSPCCSVTETVSGQSAHSILLASFHCCSACTRSVVTYARLHQIRSRQLFYTSRNIYILYIYDPQNNIYSFPSFPFPFLSLSSIPVSRYQKAKTDTLKDARALRAERAAARQREVSAQVLQRVWRGHHARQLAKGALRGEWDAASRAAAAGAGHAPCHSLARSIIFFFNPATDAARLSTMLTIMASAAVVPQGGGGGGGNAAVDQALLQFQRRKVLALLTKLPRLTGQAAEALKLHLDPGQWGGPGAGGLSAVHAAMSAAGIFKVINATFLAHKDGGGGVAAAAAAPDMAASPLQLAAVLQLLFAPRNPAIFSQFAQDMLSAPIPAGSVLFANTITGSSGFCTKHHPASFLGSSRILMGRHGPPATWSAARPPVSSRGR